MYPARQSLVLEGNLSPAASPSHLAPILSLLFLSLELKSPSLPGRADLGRAPVGRRVGSREWKQRVLRAGGPWEEMSTKR